MTVCVDVWGDVDLPGDFGSVLALCKQTERV